MTETTASVERNAGASLIVREASLADDAQICAQIRRNLMPGRISLSASTEPSFFASIEVEGHAHRVVVGERAGQIVGVGLMARRRVFLNGTAADVGYMSTIRADPGIRSSTILARGSQAFKQWHNDGFGVPFYLCSILQDNVLARRILTSGRAGLPACRDIGTFYTAAIPLLRRIPARPPEGVRIMRGGEVGAQAIVECLNRHGPSKQFFPIYEVQDLMADDGILRGLHLNDFHVAIAGDRVVGVTACWNQLPFRRTVVAGYSGGMRFARPLLSPLARVLGLAPLPRPGDGIQSVLAACVAIEDNEPRIFKALVHSILRAEHGTGKTFLMVGLMEQDPLCRVARGYLHLPTRSCIYALSYDAGETMEGLDARPAYLELGSL